MHEAWIAWLYHYGVGGAASLVAYLALARVGALPARGSSDRPILLASIGGLVLFAGLHAAWIALASH